MKKFAMLSLALLSLGKVALAHPNTSDVDLLSYGSMEPKQSMSIPLDKLAPNVNYKVICKNIHANMSADIDVYYNAGIAFTALDGKEVTSNVMQLKADHYASGYTLTFTGVNNTGGIKAIELTNLDDKAVVGLHECVAKVQH
jgi:hypothetical protein